MKRSGPVSAALLVFVLVLSAASGSVRQKAVTAAAPAPGPDASLSETLSWLAGELKRVGSVIVPGFNRRESFDWLRSDGCRIQYMLVSDRPSDPRYHSSDNYPPYGRTEFTLNLSDLNPARIRTGVLKNGK